MLSIVRGMQERGYLCWMDLRLRGGSRWSEELARKIKNCTCCVLFVSHSYILSENCADEWAYAKSCRKTIIRIHLDDVALPEGMDMELGRFQFLDYDGSRQFWKRLEESEGMKACQYNPEDPALKELDLETGRTRVRFDTSIRHMVEWLTGLNPRWGAMDSAVEAQHANTCEGLLAMKLSGYDVVKRSCYQRTWKSLCQDMSTIGLSSKSLGRETVVCTSMLLLLAAMERDHLTDSEKVVFDRMAQNLWEIRNLENGWGVFVSETDDDTCSYANTAWALRALREYEQVRNDPEFSKFCHQIFESERDGTFSYFPGGRPKLIVTAMYMGLYYRMEGLWQEEQLLVFDKQAAIRYIYRAFVEKNIQIELETLYGIDSAGSGPKKVPWNHITVWAALDALSQAYYSGDLDEEQWQRLLRHMTQVIEENVRVSGKIACYHPEGMEESRRGRFTFPTAYLVMGLSQLAGNDV